MQQSLQEYGPPAEPHNVQYKYLQAMQCPCSIRLHHLNINIQWQGLDCLFVRKCVCVCVPMPTHCTITCFGFCARQIDGVEWPLLAPGLKIFKLKYTTPPRIQPRTCWTRGRHATIWASAASFCTRVDKKVMHNFIMMVQYRISPNPRLPWMQDDPYIFFPKFIWRLK